MRFYNMLHLKLVLGNRLKISKTAKIFFPININHKINLLTIGANTTINKYLDVRGKGTLHIGDRVIISKHVCIITVHHDYNSLTDLPCSREQTQFRIIIEDNSWLSVHTIIVGKKDLTIREGSIVGAGATVTKSTERLSINGGNPSKLIGSREHITYECAIRSIRGWEYDEYERGD